MHETIDIFSEKRHIGDAGRRLWRAAAAVGLLALAAGAALAQLTPAGWQRFFFAYLVNYAFLVSLALGALFFVSLHHLTRAGWSVVLRRLLEGIGATMPLLAVLFVPVALGMDHLYPWTDAEMVAADSFLSGKQGYLNTPFFLARMAVYFGIWIWLARSFWRISTVQDGTGDVGLTLRMQRLSAPAMILFAVTVTFFSFDLLMSLDAHWFSTIFGVYYFAGSVVGILALLILVVAGCHRAGLLRRAITLEHYHDLGKLLFAFTVFWAYIAFSQYMLMWYADIPDETAWLLRRQEAGWEWLGLLLILGHFLGPFLLLMPRRSKRTPVILVAVSAWLLLMHWADLFWVVMPEAGAEGLHVSLLDPLLLVGLSALGLAGGGWLLSRHALVPERDPRLEESLGFENA